MLWCISGGVSLLKNASVLYFLLDLSDHAEVSHIFGVPCSWALVPEYDFIYYKGLIWRVKVHAYLDITNYGKREDPRLPRLLFKIKSFN